MDEGHRFITELIAKNIGLSCNSGNFINAVVEEIAEYYEIPCMIQLDEQFFISNYYRNDCGGGHPSAIIYSGMALAIERMFDKCINENKEYFTTIYL